MSEDGKNWGLDSTEPDKVTEAQMEQVVSEIFEIKEKREKLQEEDERLGAQQHEMERFIQAQLEYFGKDRYIAKSGSLEIRTKLSFVTPKTDEDKHAFFKWLQEKGIFYRYTTINSQALNGLLKEEFEAAKESGEDLKVPGISEPKEYKQVYLRKGK